MEHLFTEKGKKYAVINKVIGTGQIICREVLINIKTGEEVLRNDVETISENLLYNSPVESYYEREERKLKERYESTRKDLESKINSFRNQERSQDETSRKFYKIRQRLLEFLVPESDPIVRLIDFVTGNFEFAVVDDGSFEALNKPDFFQYLSKSEGMKGLVPNYASNDPSERTLQIKQYYDGSGSYGQDVYFFKTKKQALAKVKELIKYRLDKGYALTVELCNKAISFGIELPKDKIKEKLDQAKKNLEYHKSNYKKQIEHSKNDFDKWKEFETK